MHSKYIAGLVGFVISAFTLAAEPTVESPSDKAALEAPKLQREMHMKVEPRPDLLGKKIYIGVKGSPKGTELFQRKLAASGFQTVKTPEEADVSFRVLGAFNVDGAGKEPVKGLLADLLEASLDIGPADSPNYTHQTVGIDHVGISALITGVSLFSIADMVNWLSQKTGIAGRFNKMLTGDPRGFCYGDSCDKRNVGVIVMVSSDDHGRWRVAVTASEPKLVLDVVTSEAIEDVLKPLYDLHPGAKVKEGDAQASIVAGNGQR